MSGSDLVALRKLAESAEAETYFPQLGKPAGMNPWTILSLIDRIEELCCADCAVENTESGGPACTGCRFGTMARYLREVLAERFHLDFVTNLWSGLCGHIWAEWQQKELDLKSETCPWCFMKLKIETYERMLEGAGLIDS